MSGIRRREFLLLGGGAAAWPLAARAQQIKSVRRLGVLMPEAENDAQSQAQVRALEHGLTQLGWSPGKNLQIDYRWAAGDLHGTRLAAAELVRLAPDVLLAAATPPVRALQQATNTIPIVFAGITEPVAQGLVASLAHPGGNLTGFSNMEATFGEKWLELLKEIDPRVTRAAIVFNPQTPRSLRICCTMWRWRRKGSRYSRSPLRFSKFQKSKLLRRCLHASPVAA